jgi:hypothetical protein
VIEVRLLPRLRPTTRRVCGGYRWAVQPTDTHPSCLVIRSADAGGKVTTKAYLVYTVADAGGSWAIG